MPDLLEQDRAARECARNPHLSCLVQAPAGSGKTTLLVDRYLRLLEQVDQPEEVLALTFTRKAQAEMAHRVWRALLDEHPESMFGDLPKRVRRQSERLDWQLERLPERLRIMTLDGFALSLIRKMPWSAAGGQVPEPTEAAGALYLEAARRVIEDLLTEPDYRPAIGTWLHETGGDPETLVGLLVSMLACREQWQGLVFDAGSRHDWNQRLLDAKNRIITQALERFEAALPRNRLKAWGRLAQAVSRYRLDAGLNHETTPCGEAEHRAGAHEREDPAWERRRAYGAITRLFLTQNGTLRKPRGLHALLGKKVSGDSSQDHLRDTLTAALEVLEVHPEYVSALEELLHLPHAPEVETPLLEDLMVVLMRALYHLQAVFHETGQADFAEITHLAHKALGPDAPTDLALALDYRIQHLLIDEFQDTSIAHYTLIQSLMRGWQEGDGHTFFAVGDPMQSIYRFRQAEVGVFLNCRETGIAGLPLTPAILHDNYRSHPALVSWLNETFSQIFPDRDERETGAVRYVPARSGRTDRNEKPVAISHRLPGHDPRLKARAVVDLIRNERANAPEARIAVLFHAHRDATPIAELLRSESIPFRGLDLEPLLAFGVSQDLLMLATALLHPGDRRAWLAVLRGPCVGLSMEDLTALAQATPSVLHPDAWGPDLPGLSESGRVRLERTAPILRSGFDRIARTVDFRAAVEATWIALGGPATLRTDFDRALAERFWNALDELSPHELRADPLLLAEALERLTAPLETSMADPRLELLTIHRAKGLEWDVVILAGLDHGVPPKERSLLRWLELVGPGGTGVVLSTRDQGQPPPGVITWYAYLRDLEQRKDREERIRLAYVAATRARERLHLVAEGGDPDTPFRPRSGSLAEVFGFLFTEPVRPAAEDARQEGPAEGRVPAMREVLPLDFRAIDYPLPLHSARERDRQPREPVRPVYDWAESESRLQGTLLHELFDRIARSGFEAAAPWIHPGAGAWARWRRRLSELGMPSERLAAAIADLARMLERILADPDARWILGPHSWSASELALHGLEGTDRVAVRIDRLFRDEQGILWLIDYKLGRHEGRDPEAFLTREEERYRPQLERYARLLREENAGPLETGLYFFYPARFRKVRLG
ncbi:UvrD/REP helicase [mine drainage metagenome]|uniref:DNA 3'-5' helicase n=2 Tax=mine drainage metagenome TaxID=410659 RepID=T1CQQ4_9ZZZZ